jgi:ABC-type multidrug transport system ATPase subunit
VKPWFAAESFGVSFGEREVLKAASVWVHRGKVTSLMGRNGCGKTTLIRAALGLGRRDFGTVLLAGQAFPEPRLYRMAELGLFFLPDRALLSRRRSLRWHLDFLGDRFPETGHRRPPAVLRVEDLIEKRPWEMSRGERRRAELCLAWAREPSCLVADEPLEGLAPKDQEAVVGVLRELAGEGCGVLVTGHDVRPLLEVSDDVVWMVGGTTHGLGPPDAAREHHQFCREYLGPRG